jgi:hypothetical protein
MARERVRPYGQERIAARLLEVYDGLVRGAAGQTKGEGEG